MAIKKYTNGSWVPASFRKYGTETDIITTLPATIIGDGTPISSYTIKGNMEQSGTPTPESPIMPSECGERTENLFDKDATDTNNGYINNYAIISSGGTAPNTNFYVSEYIRVSPNTNYSWNWTTSISSSTTISMALYDANKELVRTISYDINAVVEFLTSSNEIYARVTVQKANKDIAMLTAGSTAPTSYIPYGYKLPLTLGNTTTDIYLGEVQSTRRIKKLVLTGEETIDTSGMYYTTTVSIPTNDRANFVCSHFQTAPYGGSIAINSMRFSQGLTSKYDTVFFNYDRGSGGAENFKAYLAQQYANDTPVTIWYVLASPTTGIVNEPIRKIGDYADSVSGTNLVTSGTAQEFDVETTLKPSEVDLTYHGWHEHEDTKFTT